MVQFRKKHQPPNLAAHNYRNNKHSSWFLQKLFSFIRFCIISSVIPGVFIIRFFWLPSLKSNQPHHELDNVSITSNHSNSIHDVHELLSSNNNINKPPSLLRKENTIDTITLPNNHNEDHNNNTNTDFYADQPLYNTLLLFLENIIEAESYMVHQEDNQLIFDSDILELGHCDILSIDMKEFMKYGYPILINVMKDKIEKDIIKIEEQTSTSSNVRDIIHKEFILQLLEQYVSIQPGVCNYSLYEPSVYTHLNEEIRLQQAMERYRNNNDIDNNSNNIDQQQNDIDNTNNNHNNNNIRIVYIIIAFHDFDHLQKLVSAIHLNQHYIIIHAERSCSDEYKDMLYDYLMPLFDNVILVQFGTIIYKTDTVSMINYRIMRWITNDIMLQYDYLILLDGTSYPLYKPESLINVLQSSSKHIWLGELSGAGKRLTEPLQSDDILHHKRLMLTQPIWEHNHDGTINHRSYKLTTRLPMNVWDNILDVSSNAAVGGGIGSGSRSLPTSILSDNVMNAMKIYKTISGNNGIYSRVVIEKLLHSELVREIFALAKYGCCCCLEERTWMASLMVIGYTSHEILTSTSMFQVWGGSTTGKCVSSMKNSLLSINSTMCYKTEDPNRNNNSTTSSMWFWGNETLLYLQEAYERGVMFARKFQSNNVDSETIISYIENNLWNDDNTKQNMIESNVT